MANREIYRILDAAANRGREALRVVEDATRFLDDDAELTTRLKEARHRFAAATERLDRAERLAARDVGADVGTRVETEDEYRRASLADVLAANFARLQESTRSLEEFSKIVAPKTARDWERLRYDAYTLEKMAFEALTRRENVENAIQTSSEEPEEPKFTENDENAASRLGAARRARLASASLALFVDSSLNADDADALLGAEIDVFQLLAHPDEAPVDFLERWNAAFATKNDAPETRPLLLLRDRVGAVAEFGADGAVLNAESDWTTARETLGPDALLGATVSTLDQARAASAAAANGVLDFLEVGPVFRSLDFAEATGTAFLRTVVDEFGGCSPVPLFAIGGIDANNCEEIFDSGFERVAVGRSVLDADDKRAAALRLRCLF